MKKKKKKPIYQNGGNSQVKGPISFLNSYFGSDAFWNKYKGTEKDKEAQKNKFQTTAAEYKPFVLETDPQNIGSRVGMKTTTSSGKSLNQSFAGVPEDTSIILSQPQATKLKAKLLSDVLPHEYAHTMRDLNFMDELNIASNVKRDKDLRLFGKYQDYKSKIPTGSPFSDMSYSSWLKRVDNTYKDNHDYAPDEIYSDLSALRYQLAATGVYDIRNKKPLTQEDLNKAKKHPDIKNNFNFKRLQRIVGDKGLININNSVADTKTSGETNTNMAKYGKKVKKAQNGLQGIKPPNPLENIQFPIPEGVNQLPQMKPVMPPPLQDYGVKATDPAKDLQAGLGTYPGKPAKSGGQPNWGDLATSALLLTSSLLPNDPIRNPVVRPQIGYSPQPQGRGSQAIAQYGAEVLPIQGLFQGLQGITQPFADAKSSMMSAFTGGFPLPMANNGITISNMGYKSKSKDKNKKSLRIPSNRITMEDVQFPILGVSDTGDTQYMLPGGEYSFNGNYVDEFPIRAQNGAEVPRKNMFNYDPREHSKTGWAPQGQYRHLPNVQVPLEMVGTPEQRLQANQTAQRLAAKYNLMDAPNMQIGQYLPQYVDPSGRPYQAPPTRQLPTRVPANINIGDIQSEQGLFWYIDPQTGDPVDVDPTAVRDLQFRASKNQQQSDLAERKVAMNTRNMQLNFNYGGKMPRRKYANGGSIRPLSEDTFQFQGPSHSEGGIDIDYAGNQVEVEGAETGYLAPDGTLNIMGNMLNPLTGRKFKEDSKRIAKKEQKIDELLDYSVDLVNDADITDKWDILKFNSGKVQMEGAFRKKAELQQSKQHLADVQQAMLDYSEENGLDPAEFSKGKFTPAEDEDTAQNGKRLSMAQRNNNPGNLKYAKWMKKYGAVPGDPGTDGGNFAKFPSVESGQAAMVALLKDKTYQKRTVSEAINRWTNNQPYKTIPENLKGKKVAELNPEEFKTFLDTITKGEDSKTYNWADVPSNLVPPTVQQEIDVEGALRTPGTTFNPKSPTFSKTQTGRVPGANYDLNIQGPNTYRKPSDAQGLPFSQILPELYTAATNQVEPVFMQEFTPQLYQDYEVSFQDRLNENNATFRTLAQAMSDDPASLSVLAAQKYQADNQVLAEEFRTNQAIEQDVVNKNIALLNDAELKNLGLADTQFVRQSTARSKTKQQNQIVLQSISDKIHQNALEQKTLRTYENLYPNYSFGEDYVTDFTGPTAGEALNWQPVYQPLDQNAQVTVRTDTKGNVSTTKKYPSTVQQQLQNLQLSTNKLKYNDYFLNKQRNIAKNFSRNK